LSAALVGGGGTCSDLALRVGEPVHRVRVVLDNMVRAGDAEKGVPVRVPGVKRPVPWYERAVLAELDDDAPMLSLIQCWMQGATVAVGQGVAM
jgi:hypothetical protein